MNIPLACYDIGRVNGLIASTAFWEATAQHTRNVKVYDHDEDGKTILGMMGLGWYETQTNDLAVKRTQDYLANAYIEDWWLSVSRGPAEVAFYVEVLDSRRATAIKKCEAIRHDVMQENSSVAETAGRIITGLQITRAASVIIVGGVATFGAVAAACGALGATTGAATVAAQGVGGVSFAQGLAISVIDSLQEAKSAKGVAVGVSQHVAKEGAKERVSKTFDTIHDRINPGQQDRLKSRALKKAEQFNRRLNEQVRPKKIRKWERKIGAQQSAANSAGRKAALGRAAKVGGIALSLVSFAQSAESEIAKVFDTLE